MITFFVFGTALKFYDFSWLFYIFIVCSPPFKRGGTQILKISKRGEPEKNFWGGGNQKGGRYFKLNLGIEKNKNEDF